MSSKVKIQIELIKNVYLFLLLSPQASIISSYPFWNYTTITSSMNCVGTPDELERIVAHIRGGKRSEGTFDKPERFLYQLSTISGFENRLSCFLLKENFNDFLSDITQAFANFRLVV